MKKTGKHNIFQAGRKSGATCATPTRERSVRPTIVPYFLQIFSDLYCHCSPKPLGGSFDFWDNAQLKPHPTVELCPWIRV